MWMNRYQITFLRRKMFPVKSGRVSKSSGDVVMTKILKG